MTEKAIFDRQGALGRMANNETILGKVITRFKDSYPKQMEKLKVALANQDAAGVLNAAHSLKGAALSLGAERVADKAQLLEDAGKAGELESCPGQVAALAQELEVLVLELDRA